MKTNNQFNILIVDDEKLNIELAAAYLKEEGYKLSFSLNAEAVMRNILKKDIDLILLDINMPQKDGFEVCRMLKSESSTKDIPIIFLTAQTDIEYITKAFEVGGVDYINKPFNGVELLARVKTHLQNRAYLEDIKDKQSRLAQLSITDSLTKLHNSLYFDTKILEKLKDEKHFWIVYVKFNNFDKINELYGFHASNKILKKFATILKESTNAKSITARLYGASFAILLKDYDKKTITDISNNLFTNYRKEKELNHIVNYSLIILHNKKQTTLDIIYKKLQTNAQNLKNDSEKSVIFVN
jgi:diguanylate cyclase (GGDEF)-like protein